MTVFNYELVEAEFLNFDKVQLHFGTNCLSVEVNTCTDLIKMSSSAIDVVDSDIIVVVVVAVAVAVAVVDDDVTFSSVTFHIPIATQTWKK